MKKKVYVVIQVELVSEKNKYAYLFVCTACLRKDNQLVPEGPEQLVLGHQGVLYCPSRREDVG